MMPLNRLSNPLDLLSNIGDIMSDKPKKPIKPTPPPIRRVVNEKVINKKEIEDWSRNRQS